MKLALLFIALFSAAEASDCPPNYASLERAEDLGRRYADFGDSIHQQLSENLYQLQEKVTPEFAEAWNKGHMEGLSALPMVPRNPRRKIGLTDDEIGSLLWKTRNHPLSAPNATLKKKYDCDGKGIGFCFGRAIVGQMEALKMGVAKESIRKVWAVGPMKTADGRWQHHVATMVRKTNGEWVVLDPLDRRALSVKAWLESVSHNYPSPNLQLFSTPAKRFSPYDSRAILPGTTRDRFYNNYFQDLLSMSRAEMKALLRQRKGLDACPKEKPSFWKCMKENFGIYN